MKRVSSLVIQIPGFNPGPKTLAGNNLYLVGSERRRTLIDTGEANNSQCLNAIQEAVNSEQAEIDTILLTHWHPDHVGGLLDVKNTICPNATVYKARLNRYTDFNPGLSAEKFALIKKYSVLVNLVSGQVLQHF